MLDLKLDFAEFQHFVQVFQPKMLDIKLDFAERWVEYPKKQS